MSTVTAGALYKPDTYVAPYISSLSRYTYSNIPPPFRYYTEQILLL